MPKICIVSLGGENMIHILIVEDEKPISNLIRLSLKKAGYDCTCAFDGAEAADILEERRFDTKAVKLLT